MPDESLSPSPDRAIVALLPLDSDWQPIFHISNQVVLYNPTSHALSIRHSSKSHKRPSQCPYCHRPFPRQDFEPDNDIDMAMDSGTSLESEPAFHSRASNYFQLLAIANETASRPPSPTPIEHRSTSRGRPSGTFPAEAMADGYFAAFFQEECRLGMGASGTVFLCQHMLDGNPLGSYLR